MSVENETREKKRTRLSLQQKMEIIKKSEHQSLLELASTYNAGKSVIYSILQRKEEIKVEWSRTKNTSAKQIKKCVHADVNEAVYNWYVSAIEQNLPVSRMILQQKARKISTLPSVNDTTFKASNGWLESFIKRHGISFGEPTTPKRPRNRYFQGVKLANQANGSNANGNNTLDEFPSSEFNSNQMPSEQEQPMSYREILRSLKKVKSSATAIGNEPLFTKVSECIAIVEKDIAAETAGIHSRNVRQMGTFKLVKTIGRNGSNVSAVPENWEKNNILHWPAHLSHTQREKLRSDSSSKPESSWLKQNCVIKIQDIDTFAEALRYEKQLAEPSSSSKMEDELIRIRFQNEFLVEKLKSFERETRQHLTNVDYKLDELTRTSSCLSEESGENATDENDEEPIKIEYLMLSPTESDKLGNFDSQQLNEETAT